MLNPKIANILGDFCNLLPGDKKEYPCKIVEALREESEPENKLIDIATAISYLKPCIESQFQNVAKSTTDETRSDEPPSQKTGHSTTVFAGAGSNITVTQTETGSGDVTVTNDANATKELQQGERRIDHRKNCYRDPRRYCGQCACRHRFASLYQTATVFCNFRQYDRISKIASINACAGLKHEWNE